MCRNRLDMILFQLTQFFSIVKNGKKLKNEEEQERLTQSLELIYF